MLPFGAFLWAFIGCFITSVSVWVWHTLASMYFEHWPVVKLVSMCCWCFQFSRVVPAN